MHRFILSVLFSFHTFLLCAQPLAWPQQVSSELRSLFETSGQADFIVIFRDQPDVSAARLYTTKLEKARFVWKQAELCAEKSQQQARQILQDERRPFISLRIVNVLCVEQGTAELARRIAALPEVAWIGHDPWVRFEAPEAEAAPGALDRFQVEWGVNRIQAPDLWVLGITGQGITVGGADTGYEWTHPAIQSHYRGWNGNPDEAQHSYHWHDAIHDFSPLNYDTTGNPGVNPCGLNSKVPCDDQNHGTHTMGTMTGNDGGGNLIGVAPGANWIGCRNMERGWGKPSTYLECFDWFLAPTDTANQNPDPALAPHVINNSWYCATIEGCTDDTINNLFRLAIVNLKASGVVVVISNGNEGPNCNTTFNPPAYFEESFSVGATREDEWIAGFSSRGPVTRDSSFRIKPDVSAPGQGVRSCIRNGQYAWFSGTSMAGPHVAGLVALILSARPELAGHVTDIENIVKQSALYRADTVDCSIDSIGAEVRPNNTFGWGRVNALAAWQAAMNWQAPVPVAHVSLPDLRVFPNPATDQIQIDLGLYTGAAQLKVFDPAGRLLIHNLINAGGANRIVSIPCAAWPGGLYIYTLQTDSGRLSGRLIKQ